jgi:hypothetical protein
MVYNNITDHWLLVTGKTSLTFYQLHHRDASFFTKVRDLIRQSYIS